jgi:Tol biopolymer transport system component
VKDDGTGTTPLTNLAPPGVSGADSDSPVYSPDGTKIAFESARALDGSNHANLNQVENIWVMNADGSAAKPLTHLTATSKISCVRPVWSPDGTKIAYSSGRALNGSDTDPFPGNPIITNVWVINADGTGDKPLTDEDIFHVSSSDPVWSLDGLKILFMSNRAFDGSKLPNTNSAPNVWWINSADGSGREALTGYTDAGTQIYGYSWVSHTKFVYSAHVFLAGDPDVHFHVVVYDTFQPINTFVLARLHNVDDQLPAASPDGTKIAFVSNRALDGSDLLNTNNTRNIWVANADGSGLTHLTSLAAMGGFSVTFFGDPNQALPVWSRDGSKLAFMSERALDGSDTPNTNFTMNVWVMNADGSGQKPVTKMTAINGACDHPNWRP